MRYKYLQVVAASVVVFFFLNNYILHLATIAGSEREVLLEGGGTFISIETPQLAHQLANGQLRRLSQGKQANDKWDHKLKQSRLLPEEQHEITSPSASRPLDVMIIASYPNDLTHAVALWTTLECLHHGVDKVYIAAPDFAQDLVNQFVDKVRASLSIDIEAHYFVNDRYDVGLWCDLMSATLGLPASRHKYSTVQLINDSVFLLRPYSGIRDALVSNDTLTVASLSEAYTAGYYWIESVFRGFKPQAIPLFMNHSCWNYTMNDLCPAEKRHCGRKLRRKRSIVEHFEIPIAALYPRDNVRGIFLSAPLSGPGEEEKKTWVVNVSYWEHLVREQDFPAVKVKMVKTHNSTFISNCTKNMDIDFLRSLNYSSIRRPLTSEFS